MCLQNQVLCDRGCEVEEGIPQVPAVKEPSLPFGRLRRSRITVEVDGLGRRRGRGVVIVQVEADGRSGEAVSGFEGEGIGNKLTRFGKGNEVFRGGRRAILIAPAAGCAIFIPVADRVAAPVQHSGVIDFANGHVGPVAVDIVARQCSGIVVNAGAVGDGQFAGPERKNAAAINALIAVDAAPVYHDARVGMRGVDKHRSAIAFAAERTASRDGAARHDELRRNGVIDADRAAAIPAVLTIFDTAAVHVKRNLPGGGRRAADGAGAGKPDRAAMHARTVADDAVIKVELGVAVQINRSGDGNRIVTILDHAAIHVEHGKISRINGARLTEGRGGAERGVFVEIQRCAVLQIEDALRVRCGFPAQGLGVAVFAKVQRCVALKDEITRGGDHVSAAQKGERSPFKVEGILKLQIGGERNNGLLNDPRIEVGDDAGQLLRGGNRVGSCKPVRGKHETKRQREKQHYRPATGRKQ